MDIGEEANTSYVVIFSPGLNSSFFFFLMRENLSRYKLNSKSTLMLAFAVCIISSQSEIHGNPGKFLKVISGWNKAIMKCRRFDLLFIGCLLF